VPNAPADGVVFAPNVGTDDALLFVEPNIPVVALKADVVCAFIIVPALGDPNTVVASFAVSKLGAMVLVDVFPVIPNVGTVVVSVFEPNNDVVVLPNMVPAAPVPKDVEGFVCPKIGEPLPNTEDDAVVEVEVTLALENKPGLTVLFDVDTTLVVGAKIEGAVVFELNTLVVPGTDNVAPKSGWLVAPKMFVVVVVFDVVAKIDVVDVPNCGTVVIVAPNCGIAAVVVVPNKGTAVLLVVPKPVVLEAVAAGRAIGVDAVLGVLAAPKTNTGLLIDEEVVDAPSENAGALEDPNADVAVVVVNALLVDVNELLVCAKVLDVKLNDLVVTCGIDVA
jgi:hypothetical protein